MHAIVYHIRVSVEAKGQCPAFSFAVFLLTLFFEVESHVVQADIELLIFQPHLPSVWVTDMPHVQLIKGKKNDKHGGYRRC